MNKAPVYDKPFLGLKESKDTVKYWEQTKECYRKKQYIDTVINLLNYLDSTIVDEFGNPDKTEFVIPNGSIVINISLKDGKFSVIAPFLKLPEGRENVLLRQIAEINFSSLFLTQIELTDSELHFKYTTELELCEPYKIYDVLYEICIYGDYYDDIFIDDLGAKRIQKMQVKEYTEYQKQTLWEKYREYLKEGLDYMSYFESMRWYGLALDTARITIMKIDYFMHPQGKLVTDIQKALGTSLRRNMPLNELFERTKQEIIKLNEYDQSKFNENMYIPRFLIQPRKRASITVAQSMMKNDYNAASKYLSEANYIASVQFSLYAIYNLLFRNTIPIKLEEVLNTGLKKAGSKDWKSAANQLVNTLTKVYKMK